MISQAILHLSLPSRERAYAKLPDHTASDGLIHIFTGGDPASHSCAGCMLPPGASRDAPRSHGRPAVRIVRLPFIGVVVYSHNQRLA
jgi:hypothetical protein